MRKLWKSFVVPAFIGLWLGITLVPQSMAENSFLPRGLKGWTLVEGPRTFNRKTLFEHINGQAELFLKYGFEKLVFAVYQDQRNRKNQVEVNLYDMGSVLGAFGVFSRFRNGDESAGVGLDSYLEDQSAIFYKGKYVVMLYGSDANPLALKQIAEAVSSRITDNSPPPREIGYFPRDGLKAGSLQYYSEGLLGYVFLGKGFLGTYEEKANPEMKSEIEGKVEDRQRGASKTESEDRVEGKEYQLFLALFKSAEDAQASLKRYREELGKRGSLGSSAALPAGLNGFSGEDPHKGRTSVVQKGPYLVGVTGFDSEKSVERSWSELISKVP